MSKIFIGLIVFGLVATGALNMQITAQYLSRVFVVILGGNPNTQQQYQPPFQQEQYQPTEAQEQ